MENWHPIDTAPRDGTKVLLAIKCPKWISKHHAPCKQHVGVTIGAFDGKNWVRNETVLWPPFMWMSLPLPPALDEGNTETGDVIVCGHKNAEYRSIHFDSGCSCHIIPPCSYCTDQELYCLDCDTVIEE